METTQPRHRVFELTKTTPNEYYVPGSDGINWIWGCQHYKRMCKFITPCCNEIYTCHFCHDANEDHLLDRTKVDTIVCSRCGCPQPVQWFCQECHVRFAYHFCKLCRMFDDIERNGLFHCRECNYCQIGGRGNYVHCKKCNLCIGFRIIKNHICEEKRNPAEPAKEPIRAYEA